MKHVMLDLETFGTKPGCALRSIGAVFFDLDGGTGAEFYRNIDEASCVGAGLEVEQATLDWWEKQSQGARDALLVDPVFLGTVVREFHSWFRDNGGEFVWCHGANFDEPIWREAAAAVGERLPWKFWNARCTRTAYHLAGFDPKSVPREGVYHNALDDAKFQAKCVAISAQMLHNPFAA